MVAGAHRLRTRQLVHCDLDCRGTRLHPDENGTQLIRARLLARVLVHSLSSDSSMRRFFARPSGVSLEATGLSPPRPEVLIRSAGTPAFTSMLFSASARSSDSRLSATGSADRSVCASMRNVTFGKASSKVVRCVTAVSVSGRTLIVAASKSRPSKTNVRPGAAVASSFRYLYTPFRNEDSGRFRL